MPFIKIEPALKDMIHSLGSDPETEAVKIFNMGLKEILRKCEEEILKLEIKYGMSYEEFKLELDSGELGDPFSYQLEKDTLCALRVFACPACPVGRNYRTGVKFRRTAQRIYLGRFKIAFIMQQKK